MAGGSPVVTIGEPILQGSSMIWRRTRGYETMTFQSPNPMFAYHMDMR